MPKVTIQSIVAAIIDNRDQYDALVEQLRPLAAKHDRDTLSALITPVYLAKYEIELNEKGQFDKSDAQHQACKAARNYLLRELFPAAPKESAKATPLTKAQKAAIAAFVESFGGKTAAIAAIRAAA